MKISSSAGLVATLFVPATSLSYLENLNRANPVAINPSGGTVANGASYLDALASAASAAPTGGGMISYLDSLPKNAAPSMAGGAGMASYTDALSGGSSASLPTPGAAFQTPATPAAPAPVSPVDVVSPKGNTGNYMDSLGSTVSAAPTGSGVPGYLDSLPKGAFSAGGAGIPSYKDGLPVTNTMVGTGSGMASYTDNLSGGRTESTKKPFSPFGREEKSSSFVGSVSGSQIEFTLEASDLSSLVEQLRGSGGSIKLSGTIDNISVN